MTQLRDRYHFIHNVFAHFYKDVLDWFSGSLYTRFEYRVVGTYDKAVEYINKNCQYDRETDNPMFPALILNPSGDFTPADGNAGGRQFWRYPNLNPTLIKRLFDPIYRDDRVIVHAGFIRIKGEIELIMLLNSFYEYCDLRMMMINMFGGMDRIIYPQFFSSFIILPPDFVNYNYTSEYSKNYKLDWTSANASTQLVRSTAQNELVLPLNVKPQISLTGMSDASNRYGGTDNVAEWKLGATLNYEIEMPNYLIIESDYLAEEADISIGYGSVYSAYNDYQPPDTRMLYNFKWDWGLTPETNNPNNEMDPDDATYTPIQNVPYYDGTSSIIYDTTATVAFIGDFVFNTRYFHTVLEDEASSDSTSDIYITLPEQIVEPYILIVNSAYGQLAYKDNYDITNTGWTLVIRRDTVTFTTGMILELYVYKKLEPET